MQRRSPPTLRAQAITWLAQRDHSEQELRRKLLRWLSLKPGAAATRGTASGRTMSADGVAEAVMSPEDVVDTDTACCADAGEHAGADAEAAVSQVLTWLREQGYLDDQRFAASRVDLRSPRCGLSRIRNELAQLGVSLEPAQVEQLGATEMQRAQALWAKRFGQPASDARELARQARFLSGRGFSGEVVRRVLRQAAQPQPAD
jgi:regulatory protein